MTRLFAVLLAGCLIFGAGHSFAQGSNRTTAATAATAAQQRAQNANRAVDPNSQFAKNQAAIAQGFAPIDTSVLSRGFTR